MLDINTPRGQQTLEHEQYVKGIVEGYWSNCRYLETPKDGTSAVDALIVRDGTLKAVAETKCRDMSYEKLYGDYAGEWLVTRDKLLRGSELADLLQVEYWGLLYLVPDDLVLRVKLFSHDFGWLAPYRTERTLTQKTVNGGKTIRANAYIDMTNGVDILR